MILTCISESHHFPPSHTIQPRFKRNIYGKIIYNKIRATTPRIFTKQDMNSKLWIDIGERKAVKKTHNVLQDGVLVLLKETETGLDVSKKEGIKVKIAEQSDGMQGHNTTDKGKTMWQYSNQTKKQKQIGNETDEKHSIQQKKIGLIKERK